MIPLDHQAAADLGVSKLHHTQYALQVSLPPVEKTKTGFIYLFFLFVGPHPQHMELPGLPVKSEL